MWKQKSTKNDFGNRVGLLPQFIFISIWILWRVTNLQFKSLMAALWKLHLWWFEKTKIKTIACNIKDFISDMMSTRFVLKSQKLENTERDMDESCHSLSQVGMREKKAICLYLKDYLISHCRKQLFCSCLIFWVMYLFLGWWSNGGLSWCLKYVCHSIVKGLSVLWFVETLG